MSVMHLEPPDSFFMVYTWYTSIPGIYFCYGYTTGRYIPGILQENDFQIKLSLYQFECRSYAFSVYFQYTELDLESCTRGQDQAKSYVLGYVPVRTNTYWYMSVQE
jgi:hypothetical protein